MITIDTPEFVADPLKGMTGAIPLPPLEPMTLHDSENLNVRFLGEDEGVEHVEISIVQEVPMERRPGMWSWRFWWWRPWLRYMKDVHEFDAIVKDHGDGNQTLTVVGGVSRTVTWHRTHPNE
jgi:hypothetical protein